MTRLSVSRSEISSTHRCYNHHALQWLSLAYHASGAVLCTSIIYHLLRGFDRIHSKQSWRYLFFDYNVLTSKYIVEYLSYYKKYCETRLNIILCKHMYKIHRVTGVEVIRTVQQYFLITYNIHGIV